MGFSNLKTIPYRFAVRCPPISTVARFIRWFGHRIRPENWRSRAPFYHAGVGILLLSRDLWAECGGYDERMIYMNSMEVNLTHRLMPKYTMVNLGEMSDYSFYHLEHYHPWAQRVSRLYRKVNNDPQFACPDAVNPNGADWGLRAETLEVQRATPAATAAAEGPVAVLRCILLLISVFPVIAADTVGLALRHQWNRVRRARAMLRARPVTAWPGVIRKRRQERQAGR